MSLASILCLFGMILSGFITYQMASGVNLLRFPFLFSIVHFIYIFPRIFAMTISGGEISRYYDAQGVLNVMSFMSLFCYIAGLVGYIATRPKVFSVGAWNLSRRTATHLAIVSSILGFVSIGSTTILVLKVGGFTEYYLNSGFYDQIFEGETVWLLFFSRLIYPAIASMGLLAISTRSPWSFAVLLVLCVIPLLNVIYLFRRSDVIYLIFILSYFVIAYRGVMLGRAPVLICSLGIAVTILLFPALRQEAVTGGRYIDTAYKSAGAVGYLKSTFEVKPGSEIIASAARIEKIVATGHLGWGAFLWDSLVSQFLPSVLVGPEAKKALMLSSNSTDGKHRGVYDRFNFDNLAPYGFTEAFEQFSYIGWIVFVGVGLIAGVLERNRNTIRTDVFYVVSIPFLLLSATNDIYTLPAKLLTIYLVTRLLPRANRFQSDYVLSPRDLLRIPRQQTCNKYSIKNS